MRVFIKLIHPLYRGFRPRRGEDSPERWCTTLRTTPVPSFSIYFFYACSCYWQSSHTLPGAAELICWGLAFLLLLLSSSGLGPAAATGFRGCDCP